VHQIGWDASIQRDMKVDECMGSFGHTLFVKGCDDSFWHDDS
jgi:hypothetical protein